MDRLKAVAHNVLVPDTVFFFKGKPTRFFFTKILDEDPITGLENNNAMSKWDDSPRKKNVLKDGDPDGLDIQRTVTALVQIKSSAELITVVRDFMYRVNTLKKKRLLVERLLIEAERERLRQIEIANHRAHEAMVRAEGQTHTVAELTANILELMKVI